MSNQNESRPDITLPEASALKAVHFRKVYAFWDLNVRWQTESKFDPAKDKTARDLLNSFIELKGYDMTKRPMVVSVADGDIKRRIKDHIETRLGEAKAKAQQSSEFIDEFALLQDLYCNSKGELDTSKLPEYLIADAHRRFEAMSMAAVQAYRKARETKTPVDFKFDVPIVVEVYRDMAERKLEQLRANERDTEGRKKLTPLEVVISVIPDVACGLIQQAELRKAIGASAGQKAIYFIRLMSRFPELRLLERCQMGPDNPERLRYESIDGSKLPSIYARSGSQSELDDFNRTNQKKKGEAAKTYELYPEPKAKAVNDELYEMVFGGNKPKAMATEAVKEVQRVSPNLFVKDFAEAVVDNKPTIIAEINSLADVLNPIHVLRGDLVTLDAIKTFLVKVAAATPTDRPALLKRLEDPAPKQETEKPAQPARKGR